ncbi:MAG: DMT family transporter, partial [Thermoleophilaceae bacterium]
PPLRAGNVSGAVWAALSGIGFGLFQSVNRRALRDLDPYVSTFLQLATAAVVLGGACLATEDVSRLGHVSARGLAAFTGAGLLHFLVGWTLLNLSQQRIGAARTSPLLATTPLFGLLTAAVLLGQLPSVAALAAIVPIVAGGYLVSGRGGGGAVLGWRDSSFGLGCAFLWALSPVLVVRGFEELDSPLLGVTIGLLASVACYAVALATRGVSLRSTARESLALKLVAGVLVALATWTRWISLGDASVAVVLALAMLSVPVVLFVAPLLSGRHLERVTVRVWAGSALVVAGALVLILR